MKKKSIASGSFWKMRVQDNLPLLRGMFLAPGQCTGRKWAVYLEALRDRLPVTGEKGIKPAEG